MNGGLVRTPLVGRGQVPGGDCALEKGARMPSGVT
jgi:hypothetical protein